MKATSAWVCLFTAVVFLAGVAAGVLGERMTRESLRSSSFEDYALLLQDEFDLPPARMKHLRVLLDAYANDVDRVVKKHESDYRAAMEPELRPLHEEYDRLVRDMVLPPDQRARFDELAVGLTYNPKTN